MFSPLLRFTLPVFAALLIGCLASAQVVNTEKLRNQFHQGWEGQIDVTAGFNKNKAGETFRLSGRGRVDYGKGKNLWMLFGASRFIQFREVDVPEKPATELANNHFAHLRYNRRTGRGITWEAFTQYQSNRVQATRLRMLTGGGPRFRLIQNDSATLFLGTLGMYEYEETSEEPEGIIHRDFRLSAYISGSWQLKEFLNLSLITYYQPRIDLWSDYRISGEASLEVALSDHWRFTTFFQLIYDAAPPAGVSPTVIRLSNGLGITF